MHLPVSADHLRALLAAARECGVTKLRITADAIEAEMSAYPTGRELVEDINRSAPLAEDPLDVIRREAAAGNKRPARDMLDVLADGARLVEAGNPDPTAPV